VGEAGRKAELVSKAAGMINELVNLGDVRGHLCHECVGYYPLDPQILPWESEDYVVRDALSGTLFGTAYLSLLVSCTYSDPSLTYPP
jgi:hypothetical protein